VATTKELDLSGIVAELREGGADPERVARLMCDAVVDSYRRLVSEPAPDVRADLNLETGILHLYSGDTGNPVALPSGDAARQVAQAARQAVSRFLGDRRIEEIIRTADARRNELVDGVVETQQGKVWMLRLLGDIWGLLPPEEQAKGERLKRGDHLKVIVVGGRRRTSDAVMVVSRTHPLLLQRLLEREVPELSRHEIEIKAIAREPGVRTKVAVASNVEAIDARGACIGPKGVRHRAVTSELGDEQLQIINWSEDPAQYVANALAPAEAISVTVDEPTRTANITVAPDKLSLAIGKGGENARLVAKLTGWRVDINAVPATPPA
jgi:transcription termination/antitermination protein NusA